MSFPSDLPRARWRSLECVECLEMVKPMVVDFCAIGGLQGYSKALWMGIQNVKALPISG